MIVIINGPLGVGKTETSDALLAHFERGVMLDGDYLGAVVPFDLYDPDRVEYLYQTLRHVVAFHQEHGYANFVINYVFETVDSLKRLKDLLFEMDGLIYSFRLVCDLKEIERRIRSRSQEPDRLNWEIQRAAQLVAIQENASRLGDLGSPIDTTHLSAAETAQRIWDTIHEQITLAAYDPAWAEEFELEKARIQAAVADNTLVIHHIGSTAVPGLSAKPVIDLMLVVPDLEQAGPLIQPLQGLGYTFIDHPENIDRRFFRKGSPRSHHLHIVARDSDVLADHLDFREALRADPELRAAYGHLKAGLAQIYGRQRAVYTEQKTAFVKAALNSYRAKPFKPGPTTSASDPDNP